MREADEVQDLGDLLADLRARLALDAQRVADVLGGGAVRQELEVLEHAAEVSAKERNLRALEPREIPAADDDAPLGRLDLLQEQANDGRLPGARSPDDEDELALVDREGDALERDHPRLVDLLDVLEHDHRRAVLLPSTGSGVSKISFSGSANAVIVASV